MERWGWVDRDGSAIYMNGLFSTSSVEYYSTPTAERRLSSGGKNLRSMLKIVVKYSIWFAFNVVCGGSSKILMG